MQRERFILHFDRDHAIFGMTKLHFYPLLVGYKRDGEEVEEELVEEEVEEELEGGGGVHALTHDWLIKVNGMEE